jgi:hypothetical protein
MNAPDSGTERALVTGRATVSAMLTTTTFEPLVHRRWAGDDHGRLSRWSHLARYRVGPTTWATMGPMPLRRCLGRTPAAEVVEVTHIAAVEGFKTPVFVTHRAWKRIERPYRTLARVQATLWHARFQVLFEGGDPSEVHFEAHLGGAGEVVAFVATFVVREGVECVEVDLETG